jgi:fructosamine-3-kinase
LSGLPGPLLAELERRLGPLEVGERVGGGCIHPAVRVRTASGSAFLKYGGASAAMSFAVEARSLSALRAAGSELVIPEVLGVGEAGDTAFLLLEWLEAASHGTGFGRLLGRGLAALHRTTGRWGWHEDGFIGSLPQPNGWSSTWAELWRDLRLRPQLELAARKGHRVGSRARWDALFRGLPEFLAPAEEDGPSLLHGDLWSGNVLAVRFNGGTVPALVDPAPYYGHREVDLAMAELFGGFPAGFLAAYEESWPLNPGYGSGRRAVYQLYYLLVHVNIFGAGYEARTESVLRQAVPGS